MAIEEEQLFYYKNNVGYSVGIRMFIGDNMGKVLNTNDPYVAVKESKLRDFKRANHYALKGGLLIETDEPSYDVDETNVIDDVKAHNLVKNIFSLKKALKAIDSPAIIAKLLQAAKDDDRPHKTILAIEARLEELDVESPLEMRGEE